MVRLVLEQAFSVILHGNAVSGAARLEGKGDLGSAVHKTIRALHIRPAIFRAHCEAACRKYERVETKRMAFLPDTNPFWNVVNKEKMFPIRKLPYEDTFMAFTSDIDEIMRSQYGDYMVMPPEDKRKTHYPYRLQFREGEDAQV